MAKVVIHYAVINALWECRKKKT